MPGRGGVLKKVGAQSREKKLSVLKLRLLYKIYDKRVKKSVGRARQGRGEVGLHGGGGDKEGGAGGR